MPDQATVLANRQKIDFYCWKGIPVARKWPRKANYTRSDAEVASSQAFTVAAKMTGIVDAQERSNWQALTVGAKGFTWVDHFRANMIGSRSWFVLE